MQTPTLTEARRALLELQVTAQNIEDYGIAKSVKKIVEHSTTIAAYLDAQVPLNVENILGVNDTVTADNGVGPLRTDVVPLLVPQSTADYFFSVASVKTSLLFNMVESYGSPIPAIPSADVSPDILAAAASFNHNRVINGAYRIQRKPACGKCFKCLNGGVGKCMEKADPLNLCDGNHD